jgi:hypothetical protein
MWLRKITRLHRAPAKTPDLDHENSLAAKTELLSVAAIQETSHRPAAPFRFALAAEW